MKSMLVRHRAVRLAVWGVVVCSLLLFGGRIVLSATISGIVTNGTAAIQGVTVIVYKEVDGLFSYSEVAGWQPTNALGGYEISNLSEGRYKVAFYTYDTDYIEEWYTTAPDPAYTLNEAESFTLTVDQIKDLGVTTLQAGANILGVVTDEGTGGFIENISVVVYNSEGDVVTNGLTNVDGEYDIGGLPIDSYYVQFWAGDTGYASEWYSDSTDKYTRLSSTPVSISALSDVFRADVQLATGGIISGKVTDSKDVEIVRALVEAYDADDSTGGDADSPIGITVTDTDGTYTLAGLPTTKSFKIRFSQYETGGGMSEWYNDQRSYADADVVSIGTTIDAVLESNFNWLLFLPAITHRPTAP